MGNRALYRCVSNSAGEGSVGDQYMDEIHVLGNPGFYGHLDGIHPDLRYRSTEARVFNGVHWHRAQAVFQSCVLAYGIGFASIMLAPGFQLEIVSAI